MAQILIRAKIKTAKLLMHNRFNVTIIIEPSEYLEYEINIKFGSLYENLHQEKLPAVRYKNCYLHRPLIVWLTEYYLDWN